MKQIQNVLKRKLTWLSFHRDDAFMRNLIAATGVVLMWRGIWNLLDHYFLPHNFIQSNVLSIVIGAVMVYLLNGTIQEFGVYSPEEEVNKKRVSRKAKNKKKK